MFFGKVCPSTLIIRLVGQLYGLRSCRSHCTVLAATFSRCSHPKVARAVVVFRSCERSRILERSTRIRWAYPRVTPCTSYRLARGRTSSPSPLPPPPPPPPPSPSSVAIVTRGSDVNSFVPGRTYTIQISHDDVNFHPNFGSSYSKTGTLLQYTPKKNTLDNVYILLFFKSRLLPGRMLRYVL